MLMNTMGMQMGQFITHDLALGPDIRPSPSCACGTENENCTFIPIPSEDSEFTGCHTISRTMSALGPQCITTVRQQQNKVTHFLDLSLVYGHDLRLTSELRTKTNGLMKAEGSESTKQLLPHCRKVKESCPFGENIPTAGDNRVNDQTGLLAAHTLFLRNHNKLAKDLLSLNPEWEDEQVFQEARRINIAQFQHIVYAEYLPLILGDKYMKRFHLDVSAPGYSEFYSNEIDARITNEFITAAFRFGHSTVPDALVEEGTLLKRGQNQLRKMLANEVAEEEISKPEFADHYLREMVKHPIPGVDGVFSPEIRNHLFGSERKGSGRDLFAINIMRGRERGIPGYNFLREACGAGKGRARTFDEYTDLIPRKDVDILKTLYKNKDDVDLYIGGILENPVEGGAVGPTFQCLIGDTFSRIKFGDRYFYDLGAIKETRFSEEQLKTLKETTLAKLMCDNSHLTKIQPLALKLPNNANNKPRSCASFPTINMNTFLSPKSLKARSAKL